MTSEHSKDRNTGSGGDYSKTLYLPKTDFPMRAELPKREPQIAAYWEKIGLYKLLRGDSAERKPYILHDGPPYANGHIHIGHALNKVLKDSVCRAFQMQGFNANYVPGWDCHGLPIEWKVEEQYRARGKSKDEVPVNEFRQECRAFAEHWVGAQAEEFKRLGIIGDFARPYKTMDFASEARIAEELLKFAANGLLYRGSKPIMWSVVERTALAEAEVEYHEHESDAVWVKFPVAASKSADLRKAFAVIWTTTPWTLPANRAVCYSASAHYALYQVANAENDFGPQKGELLILAENLAEACAKKAKLELKHLRSVRAAELAETELAHPLRGAFKGAKDKNGMEAYAFRVPLLAGSHVTDDAGTGFVHTAPSHGRDDFDAWIAARPLLEKRGISADIPFPVDDGGYYTADAPGLNDGQIRVLDDKGKNGSANKVIIAALISQDRLFARGRLKHSYPHSWRSKKPVIFRNTPQWFVAMDTNFGSGGTLRSRALQAVEATKFVPQGGQNRLRGMVAERPDWVLSRQRVWGVPISIFVNEKGEILRDEAVNKRILAAFAEEGADSWFASGARERFLGKKRAAEGWQKVDDILDVWFDSGCTHAFTLEDRADKENWPDGTNLQWPADLYLEGSDQHRGWFQSSLLEACGTRGRAPYKAIVTHGFTLDEKGKKMSKSLGNVVSPQDIIGKYGADILRLWVMTADYWEDQRLGRDIIQTNVDMYRKLRNIIRWQLGALAALRELPLINKKLKSAEFDAHAQALDSLFSGQSKSSGAAALLPELEQFMLHRLAELDGQIKAAYQAFDFKRIVRLLLDFAIADLSAFYFDIRKDALYCAAPSDKTRLAALYTIRAVFERFVLWLAPILPFTMEEAWQYYHHTGLLAAEHGGKALAAVSVHRQQFPQTPETWQNAALAEKWRKIREVLRVVTGAQEEKRAAKIIGSSLEAQVKIYITDKALWDAVQNIDLSEIYIVSGFEVKKEQPPKEAFTLADAPGVAVMCEKAAGRKCARSWRWTGDVGSDSEFPDVSARDAAALREKRALGLI